MSCLNLVGQGSLFALKTSSTATVCLDLIILSEAYEVLVQCKGHTTHYVYYRKIKEYVNRKGPGMVKRGGLMHDAKLADLELRLQQPYWLLHQGDCEHLIVLDQIRSVSSIYIARITSCRESYL